jgi:ankyrin repeat protein
MSVVHAILDSGFDPNTVLDPESGHTALHYAVRVFRDQVGPRKAVVEKLLASGAKVDVSDKWGRTPLFYAVTANYKRDLVKLLLAAGAEAFTKNANGTNAYDIAIDKGATLIINELLKTQSDKSSPTPEAPATTPRSAGTGELNSFLFMTPLSSTGATRTESPGCRESSLTAGTPIFTSALFSP